ncbi:MULTISPECIES: type IV secretory system conjugative DNA transfer family protein [unclassified Xanthobacter]|uniref:type IV secretory system conjugative DNA transfer family protein n=1 Tax=unclassified Xanthobacter TaxID=2623496 RepID=UPI001F467C35|nr:MULTISPECIES: type IV secretory system conjugative DNA transfer family protein [unclassified Xanthobacter]
MIRTTVSSRVRRLLAARSVPGRSMLLFGATALMSVWPGALPASGQMMMYPYPQAAVYGYPQAGAGYPQVGAVNPILAQQQMLQQQQALRQYGMGQQSPGQSQAEFVSGTAANAGTGTTPAFVDPPGGVTGYNAPGGAPSGIRADLLSRSARKTGLRTGFAEEAGRINLALERTAAAFYGRFDFRRLLVDGIVIPPVITEVRQVGQQQSDRLVHLAQGTFRIAVPARISLTAPTWRDYLDVQPRSVASRGPDLLPQNEAERRTYEEVAEAARADGIEEARALFEVNLARLERDFAGMKLYHDLARRGAVSLPKVTQQQRALALSDGGARAVVGATTVELVVTPTFRQAAPAAYLGQRSVPARSTAAPATTKAVPAPIAAAVPARPTVKPADSVAAPDVILALTPGDQQSKKLAELAARVAAQ